ncbi:MAG: RyR domain-containing protein, partial [Actinomycetota bacterium]|nr:RyR domain-containing protein [Actinomycetota bacterium]
VCVADEARAVSAALGLRASPGVPVVVTVREEDEGLATALHAGGGVVPFGVLTRVMTSDLVTHRTTEILARAKHEQYVRDERARGRTPEENPSMVSWHELRESLRESNRRFAEGVGEKLRAAGFAVVPAPLADPAAVTAILPEAQVEELAIAEHDRWCRDLIADGWRHGPGPKDPERKLHPSLVPWSELSEEDRDRDREPVRALPEMLAHVGFELRPPASPATPAAKPPAYPPEPASAATRPSRT